MTDAAFLRDLAERMFNNLTPAMGFDQGDSDTLCNIAKRTLEIQTGEPRESGPYVCYMHGVDVPTVVRFWLIGTGWLNNLKEPVAGTVAGWIGPLPYMNADPMRKLPPFVKAQEFDL